MRLHTETAPPAPFRQASALAALGVVFGDIGTSPLYAFDAALRAAGNGAPNTVLGLVSLILWALTGVVSVKYLMFILRVHNQGEGGILALSARMRLHRPNASGRTRAMFAVALVGGALLFGDAVITPAISVLSAVEGLESLSPALVPWVLPVASVILLALFSAQTLGAARISRAFGPLMLVWFGTLALAGAVQVWQSPEVLQALSPLYAIRFALENPGTFLAVMGAVFLAVTGGEALYADLGQFGRPAITRAWLIIAFPALALNYLGQGALVLTAGPPTGITPFYALFAPEWRSAAVVLATLATVVASQAVITGLFSLSRQAIELGVLPPMRVIHKAIANPHDVFVPLVNGLVGVAALATVWGFGSSEAMADAYGVSVAGAMITTTLLFLAHRWQIRAAPVARIATLTLGLAFLALDGVFVLASLGKLLSGAAVPLAMAAAVILLVQSWRLGQARVSVLSRERNHVPQPQEPVVLPGTAVFLTRHSGHAPRIFYDIRANTGTVYAEVIHVCLLPATRPFEPPEATTSYRRDGMTFVDLAVGYMEQVHLPERIAVTLNGSGIDLGAATYFASLGRAIPPERLVTPHDLLMRLYCIVEKLAARRNDRFGLPSDRTLEISTVWRL